MILNRKFFVGSAFLGFLAFLSGCGGISRLNQIDSDPQTGYAIYRSGQPKEKDAEELCKMGVTKVFALNAGAAEYAAKMKSICPNAEIVYNEMQDPDSPISADFITKFDAAVTSAKASGDKILFHCNCGCHRTGRLAAYYRMKFQSWTAAAAIAEMEDIGKDMDEHPTLPLQVKALEDYILGKTCSQPTQFCFTPAAPAAAATTSSDSSATDSTSDTDTTKTETTAASL